MAQWSLDTAPRRFRRTRRVTLVLVVLLVIGFGGYYGLHGYVRYRLNRAHAAANEHSETGVVGAAEEQSPVSIGTQDLLQATNDQRAKQGVAALKISGFLNNSAETKCADMVAKNYWSHNDPSGNPPWKFIKATGYAYSKAGENLAYGYTTSSGVVDGWMNSPTHRENLLDGAYTDVGFAVCTSDNYQDQGKQTIVVQHLGRSTSAQSSTPSGSQSGTKNQATYTPSTCSTTIIPYTTITKKVDYLEPNQSVESGGTNGSKRTCTADSKGVKPADTITPPVDRTIYVGQ